MLLWWATLAASGSGGGGGGPIGIPQQGINECVQIYLVGTVFVGQASADLTTNIIRELNLMTGDMTARLKALIVSSGTKN
jgi:hypothetical protein